MSRQLCRLCAPSEVLDEPPLARTPLPNPGTLPPLVHARARQQDPGQLEHHDAGQLMPPVGDSSISIDTWQTRSSLARASTSVSTVPWARNEPGMKKPLTGAGRVLAALGTGILVYCWPAGVFSEPDSSKCTTATDEEPALVPSCLVDAVGRGKRLWVRAGASRGQLSKAAGQGERGSLFVACLRRVTDVTDSAHLPRP